jgi:hypothetical protein
LDTGGSQGVRWCDALIGQGVVVTATYSHSLQFFPTLMTPYLGSLLSPSYTVVQLKG